MCDVYKVNDIMIKLGISKNIAYELIKEGSFPVIKIKTTYRIPKKPFDEWLNQYNENTIGKGTPEKEREIVFEG
jgi:excisionase family DNA binding protein